MATENNLYRLCARTWPACWTRVVEIQETVIVRRKGGKDVALVPATELAGLEETALSAPFAGERQTVAGRDPGRETRTTPKMTMEELRREVGLEGAR